MLQSPTTGRAILRKPKKIICALDGTWQDSDAGWVKGRRGESGHLKTPSNVTRITRAIKPEDSEHFPQIVYYQAGVGTGLGMTNRLLGGGTGLGLSEHIREAYSFLANNYSPGDSIFLIGFSRGSFTARSLGGLVGNLGLLNKKGLPFFYEIFLDWENAGNPNSSGSFFWEHYRDPLDPERQHMPKNPSNDPRRVHDYLDEYRAMLRSFGLTHVVPIRENELRDVSIKAIGVWDTVGALGIPINSWLQKRFSLPSFLNTYKWLDTELSDNVEHAFQALALDEHRAPFSPAIWEKRAGSTTYLKQTWFAGAHSNIGGSYDDSATADISLAWMMDRLSGEDVRDGEERLVEKKDWIEFYDDYLDTQQDLNALWNEEHPPVRGWSLGTLYNSFRFPQSLAGHIVRTPGRYRVTDPLTGVQNGKFLGVTNETIHASVRVRIDLGGRAPESNQSNWSQFVQWLRRLIGREGKLLYRPEALHHWELHDGHREHNEYSINSKLTNGGAEEAARTPWWEWTGKDDLVPKGQVLKEDVLGKFELQLLGRHGGFAAEIEASNKGLKSVEELKMVTQRVTHRSVTV